MKNAVPHEACPPTPAPLVSLIVCTCNRHAFLRLALRAAEEQTYPNIEAIVVDDGSRPMKRAALTSYRIPVRLVRLPHRRSIGTKRNLGLREARGTIIMHWDDDDIHDPRQVSVLACPILQGTADFTSLTFSYLVKVSTSEARFYHWRSARGSAARRSDTGPFLGTLAYSRAVAEGLSPHGSQGTLLLRPFANVSLSEDLDFVERALQQCRRMLPIAWRASVVYTRHVGVQNTWRPADVDERMTQAAEDQRAVAPPSYVSAALRALYVAAEKDAVTLGACRARARFEPPTLRALRKQGAPLGFPYMPVRCCQGVHGVQQRRPCTDSPTEGQSDCGDETFCGATKGVCTARCTCAGEAQHGMVGKAACGAACCAYWRSFWMRHPGNCSTVRGSRPLKVKFCGKGA